jgi:hypothetical protein
MKDDLGQNLTQILLTMENKIERVSRHAIVKNDCMSDAQQPRWFILS